MKICLLTSRWTPRPTNGGELCTHRLVQGLVEAGHEVTAVGLGASDGGAQPRGIETRLAGREVRPFGRRPWPARLGIVIAAFLSGKPISVVPLQIGAVARSVRRHVLAGRGEVAGADSLVIDHLQSLVWVSRDLHRLPAPVVVLHNLEAAGYLERAARVDGHGLGATLRRLMLRREARLMAAMETQVLRHASVIICLSEDDARELRDMASACGSRVPVRVLPGYPIRVAGVGAADPAPGQAAAAMAPGPVTARGRAGRMPVPGDGMTPAEVRARLARLPAGCRRIGLLGTWTWAPNREALCWFLAAVQPLLPPDCRLVLAGTGLGDMDLPGNALVLGRIDQVSSFYDAVDVVAIPSLCGSGVHEKAIEAIGTGLPVVATAHALRGLLPQVPDQVHVADSAQAFAEACATVPATRDVAAVERWAAQRQHAYREVLHHCIALAASRQALAGADLAPGQAATTLAVGLGEEPALQPAQGVAHSQRPCC